jgi:hypothetical protein
MFIVYIAICIFLALAGAIGLGITQRESVTTGDCIIHPCQPLTRLVLNTNGYTSYIWLLLFTELWTWAAAITDLSISVIIIFALSKAQTGYNMPTDHLVTKIINATMESASMTTTFAIATAISYATNWNNMLAAIDLVFLIPLPSLYTFSLLWCLQTTQHVREEQLSRNNMSHPSDPESSLAQYHSSTGLKSSTVVGSPLPIQLETKTGLERLGFREEYKDIEHDLMYEGSGTGRDFITTPTFVTGTEGESDDVFGGARKSTPTVIERDMGGGD